MVKKEEVKKKKCYIYTRVSTSMQVEGYSLEAQLTKLKREAEYRDFTVEEVFSDEGKSGKNIEGRPEFQRMLKCIEKNNKDEVNIDYVLVYKLSRFGRNAKDVLVSLERMQSYGCELICVEDGIDSSKDAGKLMISVLSAVSEIERENIRVQTMEGRNQKAREGKWNGGRPPFGYRLEGNNGDKKLVVNEEEAKIVRMIYDKFVYTSMGANGIAKFLNTHGYSKTMLMSNPDVEGNQRALTSDRFSAHFVKLVLDNPTYAGYISYNRRVNQKVKGEHEVYQRVHNENYDIYAGNHEAIISLETWVLAQEKRKLTCTKREKLYDKEHEHLLSGIVRCPECGKPMYGKRSSMKKRKDGTYYPITYCYWCKHTSNTDTGICTYRKQPPQKQIDEEVMAIVFETLDTPIFKEAAEEVLDKKIDRETLEKELAALEKEYAKKVALRENLSKKQDELDPFNKATFDRKYDELEARKDALYEEMVYIANDIEKIKNKITVSIDREAVLENAYQMIGFIKENFDTFPDNKKKEMLGELLESIEIYPERNDDGRLVKSVKFKIPVRYHDREVREILADEFWCNKETPDETVCLLSKKCPV